MTGVITLTGVGRVFPADPPVAALRDIDLHVRHGDYIGIVGPSGSGKSTLLNILGLLDRPDSGSYVFEGTDTTRLDDRRRTALRGSRIGFVFQSFHLLSYRTVEENVMLGGLYIGLSRRERRERAVRALDRVGMKHRRDFRPSRLSGGERQRAAIARALVGEPALLLCDEPTGNLDSANTAAVLDLFDELRAAGTTLLVITHDETVARRAGRQVRIADGRLTELEPGQTTVPLPVCGATGRPR
ncbi:ABC transporter ATP-binding protein [Micromonospora polyrhachis]|uniref:Putative ABC transport system ATP-binding protein n=1 Tax=Micromonospora polyrhachis TaxID=1282883 RepID=A0A7W7SRU3_9ACTN|nr:ABC transporter ATP-binding protein [Micromonospora polyrhachis]MBB4959411.1 putative ABC transport system ATP-binding protein [Micromonospora polyrhachis]